MTYTPIQTRWLKHHFAKWQKAYGWSPGEFAKQTKQAAEALATVLGIPLQDFGPPPQAVAPTPPLTLPDPEYTTVTIEPGVELMPRERPVAPSPAVPSPPHTPSVLLEVGLHLIDGVGIDVRPDAANPRATRVAVPLAPGRHIIDNKVVVIPNSLGFHVV